MHINTLRRLLIVVIAVCGFSVVSASAIPLLTCDDYLNRAKSPLPLGALKYDKMSIEQFRREFEHSFKIANQNLERLRANTSPATFENTIAPIEEMGPELTSIAHIVHNFSSFKKSKELTDLMNEYFPKLSTFDNSIYFDHDIFSRVDDLYQRRDSLGLNKEQMAVLKITYRQFIKAGARLSTEQKARLNEIDERESVLTTKFSDNVVEGTEAFKLVVSDESRLAGLPESDKTAAQELAKSEGLLGQWMFTLDVPVYIAFMTYVEDRGLREEMWRAFNWRGSKPPFDNKPILVELVKLRAERSKITGYASYTDFQVVDRMAGNLENVEAFLKRQLDAYRPFAIEEFEELTAFAGHKLEPWDRPFYVEKLRKQNYDYSQEDLRPYFPMNQVIDGMFYVAKRLFGVTFEERPDLPVWHKSVLAYVVHDRDGKELALFYLDPFPRPGKGGGAHSGNLQSSGMHHGQMLRPHVVNFANLSAPNGDQEALLTYDDVETLFHELGHALQAMLTRVERPSISGNYNVAWDAIEFPSQLLEKWALHPDVLDVYARHYETGERIPPELIEKVRRANNFRAATGAYGSTLGAMLDIAWHGRNIEMIKTADDVGSFEESVTGPYRLSYLHGAEESPTFSHIFSGGYAGGYYSYAWADTMVADAAEYFEEKGFFNPELAAVYRKEILESGGSEDAAVLYRRFRGADPDVNAILRSKGLLPPKGK